MLDSHCHLDRYYDPQRVAIEAARKDVFTIAVTDLPSHFRTGAPHVRRLSRVRLALGLHPLAAAEHEHEIVDFEMCFRATSFVGEVGLDYSKIGLPSKRRQMASFRFVAQLLRTSPKVVSLHSRGAEEDVLAVLDEFGIRCTIFHWYSGSIETLKKITKAGHMLSINPAMIRSAKGREIIAQVPQTQVLTETDGPYVKVAGEPASPWDVAAVEEYLARVWRLPVDRTRAQVWKNFSQLLSIVRAGSW